MEEYLTELIVAGLSLIAAVAGGTWYFKSKSKRRSNNVHQKNINIQGNGNRVVGGDDKSKSNA